MRTFNIVLLVVSYFYLFIVILRGTDVILRTNLVLVILIAKNCWFLKNKRSDVKFYNTLREG